MNKTQLNSEQLKKFLLYHCENNKALIEKGKNPIAISISGDAGLGKTSIVEEVSKLVDMDFYKFSPQQAGEVSDFTGYPIRQFKMCHESTEEKNVAEKRADGKLVMVKKKVAFNGETCVWVDEQAISQWEKKGYTNSGQKRQSYCPPEWAIGHEKPLLLLIDDWTRAQGRFLQALMELILTQSYMSWRLPAGSFIVLTENESESGKYDVNEIDEAMRTRMITTTMVWNEDCWASWAEKSGVDSRCINFLLMNPEIMKQNDSNINARSITMFFDSLISLKNFGTLESQEMIKMNGSSLNKYVVDLFISFITQRLDRLPSPKEMLNNTKKVDNKYEILDRLEDLVNRDDSGKYRSDIAMVLASRLINYCIINANEHNLKKDEITMLKEILLDDDIFKSDIRTEICKKTLYGNVGKFKTLVTDPKLHKLLFPNSTL